MNKYLYLLLLLFAFPSYADFSASECTGLHSNKDFSVWFQLAPATNNDNVIASKKKGQNPMTLWTNSASTSVINDQETSPGNNYEVLLTYTHQSNKTGKLRYYLEQNGAWVLIDSEDANLSSINAADIKVTEGGGVSDLKCDDDVEFPEIPPEFSNDAVYEFGVASCAGGECDIDFQKDYQITPLVFVMPTVDQNALDDDAPATLYVQSVSRQGATIRQEAALSIDSNGQPWNSQPMTEVSYFIMEPGTQEIGGHRVVAGHVSTKAKAARFSGNSSKSVNFSDFGFSSFSQTPIVLHQLQSKNNSNWETSGQLSPNRTRVRLFVELGASSNTISSNEKIAFLAAEPTSQPVTDGEFKFEFGTNRSVSQGESTAVRDGCRVMRSTSVSELDGIILKKQERAGSHGGWLRRCRIEDNQYSVVMDEDNTRRGHIVEDIGYFAFEKQSLGIDVCSYVPDGLQTNNYTGTPPEPYGAFTTITTHLGEENKIYPSSNDPQYSFSSFSLNSSLCDYPNGTTGACTFDATKTFDTLPMPTQGYTHGTNDLTCDDGDVCQLASGRHKDIIIKENARLQLTGGEYWLNELKFAEQNAQIEVLAPSVVHYKKMYFEKKNVRVNVNGNSQELLFIGHGQDSAIEIPDLGGDMNYQLHAFFYVDPRATNATNGFIVNGNNNEFHGGITANSIAISGIKNKFYPQSCQPTPPDPEVERIEIKPFNYHLTCESSPADIVEVHVFDKDNNYVSGKVPSLVETSGNSLGITFLSESNGIAQYRVTKNNAGNIGDYPLTASLTLSDGSTVTDQDEIKYVPYKFEVDDQYITAGENNQVTVSVKACSNNGQLINLGYTGSPTSAFSYNQPSITPIADDLDFTANLSDSNRLADLTFKESGHITVQIEDPNFVCDEDLCPSEGGALKGQFDVYARPWKIAICDVKESADDTNQNPATTTGTPGFIPSGHAFNINYRPIVHPDSKGTATDECVYPLTGNYALDNGPLELSYQIAYPTSGAELGSVTPSTVPSFSSSSILNIEHTWNEVGTIEFQTGATYLTMTLDNDTQNIGRFYPARFNIELSDWTAPTSQGGIAYLDQPYINSEVSVAPFSLGATEALKNYHLFAPSLLAGFNLSQDDDIDSELSFDLSGGSWSADSDGHSRWLVSDSNALLQRNYTSASPLISEENGPFNTSDTNSTTTDFGLEITSGADPVSFNETSAVLEQVFPNQPPARYGRMVLDSVGGTTTDNLSVPLRVEFWNGNGFETNTQDSATSLATPDSHICKQVLWSDGSSSDSSLSGSSSAPWEHVDNGVSDDVTANPDSSGIREQIQFWMRLGADRPSGISSGCASTLAQPWLQYNWRNLGDEDPSTVVTFGIYRGNDRVIFRGEPGLTGQ
ncbi:hypothetical protein EJ063_16855 [Vibrio aquaticus]|uniref:DUF6701 domain-containing protein n=1 Tax=Vibrio aquaticus TaxID=2496559 RepID=A0A3S0P4K7_9VIBR|nr:DUF6701 domain-containing protein [Vibrio aquaticus]RTZ14320.1 hypothetical protein EJ063_16855 [Vibrio aquaticus]